MKNYDSLEELAECPFKEAYAFYKKVADLMEIELRSFDEDLGGVVSQIETLKDLEKIEGWDGTSVKNILDTPFEFDLFEELQHIYIVALVTNNGGGRSFIVPKHLAPKNLKESKRCGDADHKEVHVVGGNTLH